MVSHSFIFYYFILTIETLIIVKFVVSAYQYIYINIYIYIYKRKTKKNATIVAIVPLGTVATVHNLNKSYKKKDSRNYCCSYSDAQ